MKLQRQIIRSDGSDTLINWPMDIAAVGQLLDAQVLNKRSLGNGMVMFFDDDGDVKRLPINFAATFIFRKAWPYGIETQFRGDVVIMHEHDFEEALA